VLTKAYVTSRGRLFILPAAFLAASFTAAVNTFNTRPQIIAAWVIGAITAACIWALRPQPEDLLYNSQNHTYRVPGSWAPLVLIIIAFCIRYGIGIALARHEALRTTLLFSASSAFLFGCISGAFLGRALNIVGAASFITSEKNGAPCP